jgi:hypothetical protein
MGELSSRRAAERVGQAKIGRIGAEVEPPGAYPAVAGMGANRSNRGSPCGNRQPTYFASRSA